MYESSVVRYVVSGQSAPAPNVFGGLAEFHHFIEICNPERNFNQARRLALSVAYTEAWSSVGTIVLVSHAVLYLTPL